jgi:hypothetical protein
MDTTSVPVYLTPNQISAIRTVLRVHYLKAMLYQSNLCREAKNEKDIARESIISVRCSDNFNFVDYCLMNVLNTIGHSGDDLFTIQISSQTLKLIQECMKLTFRPEDYTLLSVDEMDPERAKVFVDAQREGIELAITGNLSDFSSAFMVPGPTTKQ